MSSSDAAEAAALAVAATGAIALPKRLSGWRVLVPRGGPWGDAVAAALRANGASPVVSPMINFTHTDDAPALDSALVALAAGEFDWVTVTSATTVDVLSSRRAVVPEGTRIAAVGEATASALTAAGYTVDLVPSEDNTAKALLEEWAEATGGVVPLKILTLRSQTATPVLTPGLIQIGHDVQQVVAYRIVGVPVPAAVVEDVVSGRIQAILVTSGSIAEQVLEQLSPIPESTLIACIGPRTAKEARRIGLRVDTVAERRSVTALIDAVIDAVGKRS